MITVDDKEQGLKIKYHLIKADGKPLHPNASYFVLRLDEFQNDLIHREACIAAINTYADKIADHLPVLSRELKELYPV